jgi:DNA repair protein RecO (recombination protein O)
MAIEKTKAFVLKTLPYRESSGIFYLLTEQHGLVHGLAKGIRKKKTGASFLERGFLIETLIYLRPHRELHTLANIEMMEYYPRIRNDLVKGAVRDAAFETILASLSSEFPAPELFSLVGDFLSALSGRSGKFTALLWNFYGSFSQLMGFGINGKHCVSCKNELPGVGNLYLLIEKGGFACDRCMDVKDHRKVFPIAALDFFSGRSREPSHDSHPVMSIAEERRITRLFASYCQYHCDTKSDLKALKFLESLLFPGQTEESPLAKGRA